MELKDLRCKKCGEIVDISLAYVYNPVNGRKFLKDYDSGRNTYVLMHTKLHHVGAMLSCRCADGVVEIEDAVRNEVYNKVKLDMDTEMENHQ